MDRMAAANKVATPLGLTSGEEKPTYRDEVYFGSISSSDSRNGVSAIANSSQTFRASGKFDYALVVPQKFAQ